jgi:MarR family transcriptional regulator, temperature-dependent positive regulator of motility
MRAALRDMAAGGDGAPEAAALDPMTAVKLWHDPCWLSFRINYLANLFNGPVYDAIAARHGLHRPDFVVLYSVGLKAGCAAKNVAASSGLPKNTISRAVQCLLRRRLIRRVADARDGRRYALHLTPQGQRIFDAELAPMLARERALLSPLDEAERRLLCDLLARLVAAAALRSDTPHVRSEKDTPTDA